MNETQVSQLPVYAGNDLGAVWRSSATAFRLWAPTACSAALHRFATGTDAEPEAADLGTLAMQRSEGGTWYLELAGDLAGQYYQYELQFPDGTSTVTADPYAHAAGAGGTRSMVLNQAAAVPDGWQKDERPAIPAHARSVWEWIKSFAPRTKVLWQPEITCRWKTAADFSLALAGQTC